MKRTSADGKTDLTLTAPCHGNNKLKKPRLTHENPAGRFPLAHCNHMPNLLLIFLVVLFAASACTLNLPSQTPVLNQPETQIIDFQSSIVMKALLQVLTEKRFSINAGKTHGLSLETEWLQDGSYRSMVLAEVQPLDKFRSRLKVNLLLQKKGFLRETWQPVDKIDKTVYKDFMNDVLIESYRVIYDRR